MNYRCHKEVIKNSKKNYKFNILWKCFISATIISNILGCDKGSARSENGMINIDSSGNSAKAGSPQNNNLLEQALNPFSGNRDLFLKVKDEGGLSASSDFYGIPVQSVNVTWDTSDRMKAVFFRVGKEVSPKAIREGLSNACKINSTAWVVEGGSLTKGVGTNGDLECGYLTNDSATSYDVHMERR